MRIRQVDNLMLFVYYCLSLMKSVCRSSSVHLTPYNPIFFFFIFFFFLIFISVKSRVVLYPKNTFPVYKRALNQSLATVSLQDFLFSVSRQSWLMVLITMSIVLSWPLKLLDVRRHVKD